VFVSRLFYECVQWNGDANGVLCDMAGNLNSINMMCEMNECTECCEDIVFDTDRDYR
jgi:hypothetical protein